MGRRSINNKLTFDPKVIEFQIVRHDALGQLQSLGNSYGLTCDATVYEKCEGFIFQFAFQNIPFQRLYSSANCRRYYKALLYEIIGFESQLFNSFITTPSVSILNLIRRRILFEDTFTPTKRIDNIETSFDKANKELDTTCSGTNAGESMPFCRKCRTNKYVDYKQTDQTRGADEGGTLSYKCFQCKTDFRVSS